MHRTMCQVNNSVGDKIGAELCKLCGKTAVSLMKPEFPVYYHCNQCDLIFIDEAFHVNADDELKRYKQHNNSGENKGYVNYLRDFLKAAEIDSIDNVKSALDFGCGPEPVLKTLLLETGIDNVDVYDPYFFPDRIFKGKKYGLITCTEVLEHLKDPFAAISLLHSLLSEKGILAIKTLFHTTSNHFDKWWYRNDTTHICFYSAKTFNWMSFNFGFKINILDDNSICIFEKV